MYLYKKQKNIQDTLAHTATLLRGLRFRIGTRTKCGFTLVELLVVIAIIGLIAVVAMVSFNATRQKAREKKRKADVAQARKAFEMYQQHNGAYPVRASAVSFNQAALNTLMAPYMTRLPRDPVCPGGAAACNYRYITNAAGSAYGIHIRFSQDGPLADCKYISPGGTANWFGAGVAQCTYTQ